MSQHRSIEVKVGILIIVALGLLAGFIIVMGGLSLEPNYRVNVDFENPGGLKTGAPVRLAGVRVGKVSTIEFRGQEAATKGGSHLIRVVTELEHRYKESIHEDSSWFISTQGVLGEFFLAVEPGSPEKPPLGDGAVVKGVSPPRLDLLLSEAYELLHHLYLGITKNEKKLEETFDGLHRTLVGSGQFFERNAGKMDAVVDNVEVLTLQASETLQGVRHKYVDNPKIDRTIDNLEVTTSALRRDMEPLLRDTQLLAHNLANASEALTSSEQLARYQGIAAEADAVMKDLRRAVGSTNRLLERVQQGRGSAGAFIMDEGVYDDLQELLRDLKHNPWKLFWRE